MYVNENSPPANTQFSLTFHIAAARGCDEAKVSFKEKWHSLGEK